MSPAPRVQQRTAARLARRLRFPRAPATRLPVRGDAGFSLLELMIALGVFSVGIMAILALLTMSAGYHKKSKDRVDRALIADSLFEEIEYRFTEVYDDRNDDGRPDGLQGLEGDEFRAFFPFEVAEHRFRVEYERIGTGHLPDKTEVAVTITFFISEAGQPRDVERFQKVLILPYPPR